MERTAATMCVCLWMAVLTGCRWQAGGRDRAVFVDDTDEFARALAAKAATSQPSTARKPPTLKATGDHLDPPASAREFRQAWHFPPVQQGLTGQCWSFAATSFFESEIHRLSGRELKLSEMHTAYWEFVEKARRFVQQRGDFEFGRGSEPEAVLRIWKQYGVVPASAYSGVPAGCEFYDDRALCTELRSHLGSLRQREDWDEARAMTAVRAILDKHLGAPPEAVSVDGRHLSPREYLSQVVGLDPDDYVNLMSLAQEPFYQWRECKVPDNWRRSQAYFNVPLDDFVKVIRRAAAEGQSLCLIIDNTGPGYLARQDVAFVPTFDIPSALIDDAARQLRFSEGGTTDDHAVHLVGTCERNGQTWYLIKDSGTKPRNGRQNGYTFFREDYVRLKTLAVLLPREFAEKALGRPLK